MLLNDVRFHFELCYVKKGWTAVCFFDTNMVKCPYLIYNKNKLRKGHFFMNQKYSEEFKLSVVKEYYEGNLGIRTLAQKYNLPSKNYITNWIKYFKENGTIPQDASASRTSSTSSKSKAKTPYEKELEKKLALVKTELAFYKKCDEIIIKSKKK